MTESTSKAKIVRKLVVVFDICSSTSILDDLLLNEQQLKWRSVLIDLKKFLFVHREALGFEMYKFLGDGWILLFDSGTVTGGQVSQFMTELCERYEQLYEEMINDILSRKPKHVGVTFGIDEGSLVRIIMDRRPEYVGRAMNVAARLQAATKQLGDSPAGTVLMSSTVYKSLAFKGGKGAVCQLANLTNGEQYQAKKLVVHHGRTSVSMDSAA